MNLEGSLDVFGLPDVVTLLATTGKTGALGVRRIGPDGPVEGVLWFHDGRLGGASSDRGRASLVRRLVGSGAVDDAALRSAVARSVSDGTGLAKALLDAGSVDPELVGQAAADQTIDAVFDVLRWPDGDFGFDQTAGDHDDVGLRLDPAAVLVEASARIAQWGQLEAVVPGSDSVLSLPVVLADDPILTRDEWALLSLVDGRRRVQDLVELTGCGHFAVMTTLARLVQRGLVHVHDAATPDHVGVVERRLGLLASVEASQPTAPTAPAAPPRVSLDPPAGPGSLGMNAAAALAAARAAQAHAQPGAPGSGRVARQPDVVPARPEPFQPERRPEHPEPAYASHASLGGAMSATVVEGATARTLSDPIAQTSPESTIERDPSVNRSLLLRLIAGVRGL